MNQSVKNLPLPVPPFSGTISDNYKQAKADFPQPVAPPSGAPNVLVILIDDLGYGGTSMFGGLIPTPNIDQLAKTGLRYSHFHNCALCSPTRAALLSGRNHHRTGNGAITEGATGFPGYNSMWADDNAAIPQVLAYNGYSTAAFGKWHNTPDWETSPVGPFDRWPTGKGFQTFYGFMGGETNQYTPQLFRNTSPVEPDKTPEEGYHLTDDLATKAIEWLHTRQSIAPDRPWFLYWAPGAMHAPHHVPEPYIERFKGQFDIGWDAYREQVFENQKKVGAIPADAKLTPRPSELPAWDSHSAEEKRLFARQMECFAGFLVHLDEHIGRLLEAVNALPGADNTLIVAVLGDNGCSPEGGLLGTLNNMATQNGFPDDLATMLSSMEEIGQAHHENHFAVGWAWAIDCPFQWTKQVASHFGGNRTGVSVTWPSKIRARGEVRPQFQHVVDIAPTIYEAAGIVFPDAVNGVTQQPLDGSSFVHTFNDESAPSNHLTQYFENSGNRAIYHDGWIASARHGVPWILRGRDGNFDADQWELYDLRTDFSQSNDLAQAHPEKLAELLEIFRREAEASFVFPLDDRFSERAHVPDRPSVIRGRTRFKYYGGTTRISEGTAPDVKARTHSITARLVIPSGGADGVIVAAGGSAGYSFFVKDGALMYENNFFGRERDVLRSTQKLPEGEVTVAFHYTHESDEYGGGGSGRLLVNDKEVATGKFAHVPPVRYSATETMDIGRDLGEAVSSQYQGPFAFTGTLKDVVFEIG
ncbi:MAG TPA: arylsulfatase [Stenotrophomonas sp.]|nr:arylsulfatase [Stenotrophomonas sp.]